MKAHDMENKVYSTFYRFVERQPDQTAVIDGGRNFSYRMLDAMAAGVQLRFSEAKPRRVAVMMRHGVRMIAAILGTLRSGACYIPIETSFPIDRVRFMIEESGADFIIVDKIIEGLDPEKQIVYDADLIPGTFPPIAEAEPSDLAYILYTSGTTGRPKGIKVENRNVCHYARAFHDEFDIAKGDVMLQHSVCTFDIFVEELFATLLNGASLAIPSRAVRNNVAKLMKFVERNRVTIITGFPYLLQDINRYGKLPDCVRLLISGGDVLRASYIDRLKDKTVIYNTYGPSETTVCATYQRCDNIKPFDDGTFPIGHPVKGARVEVLDDALKPVPDGEMGEICIIGDGVSQGYIGNRPEQANFVTFYDGLRMYRSGDMGCRLPDGTFTFAHRKDSQVMILGKRVECNEVENVLCECQEISQAAVRPIIDSQGLAHLVAYVVPDSLSGFSIRRLKAKLAKMLTSFMIPEVFVKMKSMPLTPNGKVDDLRLALVPIQK